MSLSGSASGHAETTILLTRPQADSEKMVPALAQMGLTPLIDPMLTIHHKEFQPDGVCNEAYDAFMLTSTNALHKTFVRNIDRTRPLYAIGPATADKASLLGFETVIDGGGTITHLAQRMEHGLRPSDKILFLSGEQITPDTQEFLVQTNLNITRYTTYTATPAKSLHPDTIALIKDNKIDNIAFCSARTASIFCDLVKKNGQESQMRTIRAFCLSNQVLESAQNVQWGAICSAKRPNLESLYTLIETTLNPRVKNNVCEQ